MTDVATTATPVATPSAPTGGGNAPVNPGAQGANPGATPQTGGSPSGTTEQKAAARVELAKMDPGTIVSLVVDGQEVEMKAADAFKLLGRNVSANKKFEEAASERRAHAKEVAEFKAYQQHFTQALSDPRRFRSELAALGMSPREIAKAILQVEEQDAALTPEQRRLREYEERDEQRTQEEERAKTARFEAERTQHRDSYEAGFHSMMTVSGIPEGHVMRDVLMPTLARMANHILETEGRDMKRGEAKQIIAHLLGEASTVRAPSDEQRRAMITDADYEAWQAAKRAQRPLATPQADRPRDANGKFLSMESPPQNQQGTQRNVHGERVVQNLSSVWGDKM
jgi:hypothetical protein